ncbi:hemicentin-2-like [Mya arenaria]|uniref:hemicentin-2-like n=1 Tax=Mya arenaria TaxID=6604 RepID=UPI0022E35340|nr:hemicentin-2-like [Mya arenaria]
MKTLRCSLLLIISLAYGRLVFDSDKSLVNIDDSVTLNCANNAKDNPMQIIFNNKILCTYDAFFSQITNNFPSKYGVNKTISVSSYVLHLTVLQFSNADIGQYDCRDPVTMEKQSISLDKPVQITRITLTPTNNPLFVIENRPRQIKCETDVGRPAATVRWFKGGTDISSQATVSTLNGITTSVLQLTPRTTDQSNALFCTADNGGDVRTSARSTLNVLYGPTVPKCIYAGTMVKGQLFLREGQVFTLNCSSSGNPSPNINWIPPGMASFNSLTLDGISRNNDGVFTISASNILQPTGLTAESMTNTINVTVTVYYPPDPIKCSVGSAASLNSGTIKVVGGSTFTIDCTTSSKPNPGYSWSWPGGNANDHQLSVINIQTEGPFEVTAHNSMSFSNGSSETGSVRTSFSIRLLYPPSSPTFHFGGITGSIITENSLSVISGNTTTVGCVSTGNPVPTFSSWSGTGQLWTFTAHTAVSRTCVASNTLDPTGFEDVPRSASGTLNVKVLLPPTSPQCTIGRANVSYGIIKVIQDSNVSLLCSSTGNPMPDIFRWTFPSGQVVNNRQLSITRIQPSENNVYSLTVQNKMEPNFTDAVNGITATSFTMMLLYPPAVSTLYNITVLEGLDTSAKCQFVPGYPTETQIKWTRSYDEHVISTSQTLFLSVIKRSQADLYRCTALNVMEPTGCNTTVGSSHSELFVDVQYETSITDFAITEFEGMDVVELNKDSRILFHCGVDSNPGSHIEILKDGQDLKQANNAQSLGLVIERSQCEDDGIYTCTGRNIHNTAPVMRMLTVFVRCSPQASTAAPPNMNFTSSSGVPATLTFSFAAYPRPNITDFLWEKGSVSMNGWTLMQSTHNVKIVVSLDRLQTSINFTRLQTEDFGYYRVNVSNELGRTSHIFHLQAQEVPNIPHSLHVSDSVTKSSFTIVWTPGFDGGLPQTFFVQYREVLHSKWMEDKAANDRYNYTLRNLTPGTTYELRLYAENDLGRSHESSLIKVTTLTDAEQSSIDGAVIGGAVGGSIGAVVVIAVVVFILRRNYTMNCIISRKRGIPDEEPESGRNNPGYSAAQTYEEVSMTNETSVYDALKDGDSSSHVYTPLDESTLKSSAFYENTMNEYPVYNNTVLKNPVQTML